DGDRVLVADVDGPAVAHPGDPAEVGLDVPGAVRQPQPAGAAVVLAGRVHPDPARGSRAVGAAPGARAGRGPGGPAAAQPQVVAAAFAEAVLVDGFPAAGAGRGGPGA